MRYALGVDMGGTWIRAALGTDEGAMLRRLTAPVDPFADNSSIITLLEKLILDVAGECFKETEGIGIAAAGKLNLKRSTIVYSPHTSIRSLSIESISEKFQKPVTLLNDGVAAALAEWKLGAGKDQRRE